MGKTGKTELVYLENETWEHNDSIQTHKRQKEGKKINCTFK